VIRYKHILVPTDFSPCSRQALDAAIEVARAFDATIRLLHVVVPLEYPFFGKEVVDSVLGGVRDGLQREKQHAVERGVTDVETLIAQGPAAREIVSLAGSGSVDLVVMGTHGRSGLDQLVIGSVAEKVVRRAPCHVMTIREQVEGTKA
jgi:nucleotide-binding universal stress UspA family protein